MVTRKVNICRPGYGSACLLCCGSHEGRMSPQERNELLRTRGDLFHGSGIQGFIEKTRACDPPARDKICPWLGTLGHDGLPGCLIYDNPDPAGSRWESFFYGTCRIFWCRSADILDDDQVVYAARMCRDWYLYSMIINSPAILLQLMSRYPDPLDVPPGEMDEIRSRLNAMVACHE